MIALAKHLNGHHANNAVQNNHAESEDVRLTTLSKAVLSGELSKVKVLIDAGANVNNKDSNLKFPLWHACEAGYLNIALYLIQRGANIRANLQANGANMSSRRSLLWKLRCCHVASWERN